MIVRHWDGIVSYCYPENKVSQGLVEGLNNKIRVLQRRAYCDRKLNIVAGFLPSLTRTRKMTHCDPRSPNIFRQEGFQPFLLEGHTPSETDTNRP